MGTFAVLIDVVSIQNYVFGSNKLKENLGASFLVQDIYQSYLEEVVKKIFPSSRIDLDSWKNNSKTYDRSKPFNIGYIGGGNALLFFHESAKAEEFIREWTKTLLVEAPGILTAVACEEFDLGNFTDEIKKLFQKLQENKRKSIPQTIIPRHGITAECSRTGYSMELWNDEVPADERNYISSVAYAKNKAAKKAKDRLEEDFASELDSKYCFTDQLDKLGQSKGEDSHIAIVHIDGNEMGERFRNTRSLEEVRALSCSVKEATDNSVRSLLNEIISNFSMIQDALGFNGPDKKSKCPKLVLPLRPIIIGGDDITFVCDGRLGIYFAKVFMEAFESQKDKKGEKLNLSSCAGIAITKTKYPFYRGYELSEQLCKNAKSQRKEHGGTGSWLDFHVAYGGFSGGLKKIRETHFQVEGGNLCMRPYHIGGNDDEQSFKVLVENTKALRQNFPKSKIMELRRVLTLGEEARKTFVQQMEARGSRLPKIAGRTYEKSLFEDSKTPYFDMIELMDFYPLDLE